MNIHCNSLRMRYVIKEISLSEPKCPLKEKPIFNEFRGTDLKSKNGEIIKQRFHCCLKT